MLTELDSDWESAPLVEPRGAAGAGCAGSLKRNGRTAGSELNLIAIKQRRGFADALVVDQRSVKALEIGDRKLITALPDLSVTARNHRRIGIDDDFTFRIAAKTRDFAGQLNPAQLPRARINQIEVGRPASRRRTLRSWRRAESESSAAGAAR